MREWRERKKITKGKRVLDKVLGWEERGTCKMQKLRVGDD